MMESCFVCGVEASQKCAGCNLVFYCSRDHQVVDWKKGHKKKCKCYDIECNDSLGRFMTATRDIKPGEIILKEKPFVIGPKTNSHVLCLGCHKQLPIVSYYCSKCTWPVCGKSCETSAYHADECKVMAAKKFKCSIKSGDKFESCYCVIVLLRLLLLKEKNPAMFAEFFKLESHLSERRSTKLYEMLRINLVSFLMNFLQIQNTSETEILEMAGKLDTNCFEVFLSSKLVKIRGIYLKAAMMAHDCCPNTKHCFDENFDMKIIATTAIKKGELILTSYTHPLRTTIERRIGLKQAKCFDCLCARCKDPTEMNSFASSIKCNMCDGIVTSIEPLNNFSAWKCTKCAQTMSTEKILPIFANIRNKLDTLEKKSIEKCEKFLEDHKNLLPSASVFMVDVKYALCLLYGNVVGYFYDDLSLNQINRKLNLCDELKETLSLFEPGESNSVLNCKFELTASKIMLAKQQSKKIDDDLTSELMKNFELLFASSENKLLLESRLKRIKELTN